MKFRWRNVNYSVDIPPKQWKLILAFASVYVIWGSTYLAIRFAIETIPPFFMAGVRFLIAGGLLYGWARLRGAARPERIHWKSATIIGALLLLGGNGGVTWAEQRVPRADGVVRSRPGGEPDECSVPWRDRVAGAAGWLPEP